MDNQIQLLRSKIETTESYLRRLKTELERLEQRAEAVRKPPQDFRNDPISNEGASSISADQHADIELNTNEDSNGSPAHYVNESTSRWPLLQTDYRRYGRQLIMPEIGLHGQLRLKKAKVLIVGMGGLGCPSAAYLVGAGVGTIGLVDGDTVELSNLHRQIAHTTERVGMSKVDSASCYLHSLNPNVHYQRHHFHLTPERAISIFEQYDLILDCTDHPTSRYLISDACVLTGKPLVSASALRTEGQLIVLNNPPKQPGHSSGGPCYRCIFPKPPPADSIISCGEGGILGPVVGVMGVLQALEAIKILTNDNSAMKGGEVEDDPPKPSMLMFSAYSNPPFRTVRLRSRRKNCLVCSSEASITKESLTSGSLDYVAFCGAATSVDVLPSHLRIAAADFAKLSSEEGMTLIDTRDETHYAICALPNSINVPWIANAETWLEKARQAGILLDHSAPKYVVCRFGNDSQLAAAAMNAGGSKVPVRDIKGGLQAWRGEVDPTWPDY